MSSESAPDDAALEGLAGASAAVAGPDAAAPKDARLEDSARRVSAPAGAASQTPLQAVEVRPVIAVAGPTVAPESSPHAAVAAPTHADAGTGATGGPASAEAVSGDTSLDAAPAVRAPSDAAELSNLGAPDSVPPGSTEWETVSPESDSGDWAAREMGPEELAADQHWPAEVEEAPVTPPQGTPRSVLAGDAGSRAPEPRPAGLAEPSAPRASRPPDPPWVDELPDSVTPYEQRISETVKVADLPPVEQLRGRVLANRYLAEEVAETTAASVSYRAYHLALDRAVTVRVLPRGLACLEEDCHEVRRLAAIASALTHPNIASTLDFGVLSDGWPYLVTEHVQGRSLSLLVADEGKLVLRRVLHIGKQLAAGLIAAHEAGLVHGLFSPDNVMVIDPGTPAEIATIVGFGVSSARGSAPGPPRSGAFGVPFYVSPEQASCQPLDARSDLYSLGIILYELMTGSPPFTDGDFASVLCQHLDDEAEAPSTRLRSPGALAKAMDAIVQRCLHKEPSKRYQTAAELAADLIRLEAAAERTKRRPMPEVKRPTATIHSPPPKTESPRAPGAKVIVHGEPEEELTPPSPAEGRAPRTSASPAAVRPPSSPSARPGPGSPPAAGTQRAGASRPPRAGVDHATIKISAADRDRIIAQRPAAAGALSVAGGTAGPGGALVRWLRSGASWVVAALRRLFTGAPRRDDSQGS